MVDELGFEQVELKELNDELEKESGWMVWSARFFLGLMLLGGGALIAVIIESLKNG